MPFVACRTEVAGRAADGRARTRTRLPLRSNHRPGRQQAAPSISCHAEDTQLHVAAPARAGAVRGHVQAKQGARTLHRSASIGERPCVGRLWKQRAPRGTSSTTWRRHCSPLLVVAAAEVRRCTCRAVHEACAPKAAARSLATGHSATFDAQAVPLCTSGSTAVQQQGQGHANTCFSCALSMVNELNGYN